ncbi:MAG: hypothetical protein SNJ53_05570 [Thermodesulfovibrionales bacterium]
MNKEFLIESISKIRLPESRFVKEYSDKKDDLVIYVNKTLIKREDIEKLIGPEDKEMMQNNHYNHALFMESILTAFNPNVFVETILWVFKVYRAHGFHELYWTAQLNAWLDAMRLNLSKDAYAAIEPVYHWLIVNLPIMLNLQGQSKD